jgi:ferric-dicitrate binding protein FerR (iron transport regulator)
MEQKQLQDLLHKYNTNIATPEEIELLESWYLTESSKKTSLTPQEVEEAEQVISAKLDSHLKPAAGLRVVYPKEKLRTWIVAAAVFCLIISGVFLYTPFFSPSVQQSASYAVDIEPGRNAATLTLADGKKIALSEAAKGEVAKESGVVIRKSVDGMIEYLITDQNKPDAADKNTLSTAKSETYRIRLPDGTAVWLNAASSLKFPVSFTGKKSRRVELSGEAYFEVFEDKSHPFIVLTDQQEVRVLGTHFNISSYPDEPYASTTLVEGSVKVSHPALPDAKTILLKPGQRSMLRSGNLEVSNVDTQEAIAWKNGDFMFKNEHIESIMRKLSRWYDIEVSYEGDMSDLIFIGVVSRSKNISAVLKIMESTGNIHFKIEGRRVTIRR